MKTVNQKAEEKVPIVSGSGCIKVTGWFHLGLGYRFVNAENAPTFSNRLDINYLGETRQ